MSCRTLAPLSSLLLIAIGLCPACSGGGGTSDGGSATEATSEGASGSATNSTDATAGTSTSGGASAGATTSAGSGTAASESDATGGPTGSSGGSSGDATTASTSTGAQTSGDTTGVVDTTSTSGGAAVCGDGVVDPGESCDDGNGEDGDGCEADCTWTPCAVVWSKTYSIDGRRLRGTQIAALAGGDVALAVNDNPAQLDNRLRLTRLNEVGDELWSTLVLDVRSQPYGLAVAEDGTVVVSGVDSSNPFSSDLTAGYDGDGKSLWSLMDLFPQASIAEGVAALSGGDLAIAGSLPLAKSAWLARVSSGGALIWKKGVSLPEYSILQLRAVAADEAAIYAVGNCVSANGRGGCVARFGLTGDLVWIKQIIVEGPEIAVNFSDVDVGAGGVVAVTGDVFTANKGVKPGSDIYTGLFDADGALLWSDIYDSGPDKTYDQGDGVAIDGFGNVIVAGRVPDGFLAGHIRKYDADGALICETTISVVDDDNTLFLDVVIADDGFPRITGDAGPALYIAALTP